MSELLQMNLFQSMMAEHLLQMAALKVNDKESLLFKIQAAVKVSNNSLTVHSTIIKKIKKDKEDKKTDEYVRNNRNDNDVL